MLTSDVFLYPPPYFLRQSLSLNLELTDSARMPGWQAPRIILSPLSQHQDYRHVLLRPAFYMGAGVKLSSLYLCGKHFTH